MGLLPDVAKSDELKQAEQDLLALKKRIAELRKESSLDITTDYELKNLDGSIVKLSELFGDKEDLIVVHNMGKSCPYCTLWADGFNGVYKHFEDRAAFVLVSHNDPQTAKEFSEGRGWKFRILSNDGGSFTYDMGYADEQGNPHPGVSTFHKDKDGTIRRIAHTSFGPGDDFCSTWHLFDLLEDGPNNWQPKFNY